MDKSFSTYLDIIGGWPGSLDEEQFTGFVIQFCGMIILMVTVFVCLVKKCGRKSDWHNFKSIVKKADYFKDDHVGNDKKNPKLPTEPEPEGLLIGGIFTLAFVGVFGGMLFIVFMMWYSFNVMSTQVLMPKFAEDTFALASKFSIDIEVVGFTGCLNGSLSSSMDTRCSSEGGPYDCCAAFGVDDYQACVLNEGGAYDEYYTDPTRIETVNGVPEVEGQSKVQLLVSGLCFDPKVKGAPCLRNVDTSDGNFGKGLTADLTYGCTKAAQGTDPPKPDRHVAIRPRSSLFTHSPTRRSDL